MSESYIKKSSGRIPEAILNFMLKRKLGPELSVDEGRIEPSRHSMDKWGGFMPSVSGVTIKPETLAGVSCEIHTPKHANGQQVILYMHGGGFCVGSPVSHRNLVSRLAQNAGMKIICINYRKAPEHPFPAALEDTVAVYQHCLQQGIKANQMTFCGDSAGGNLVLTTLLKLKQDNLPMPAAGACISPWCDLTFTGATFTQNASNDLILTSELLHNFADCYVPVEQRAQPLVSPALADMSGLPPLLIQVGSSEILLDDARMAAAQARKANVPVELEVWQDMQHVWHYSSTFLKDGRLALEKIASFFKKNIGNAKQM